jgi:hypothetical protein
MFDNSGVKVPIYNLIGQFYTADHDGHGSKSL